MPEQTLAFELVQAQFSQAFPGRALSEPDVRWWTESCPGTHISAVILGRSCYSGLFYRQDGVDVAWRGTVGQSAYSHELMHYFLDHFGLGSDPQHQQTPFWDIVNLADTRLQQQNM